MYFGVLPRLGRSGSQSDVQHAGVLFADIDGGDDGVAYAAGMLTAAVYPRPDVPVLPRPHIAVRSGGGVHAYWLLDAPVALPGDEDRLYYKKTLRRFVQAIGGVSPGAHADPACCDPARILRVPGTFNYKQDIPRPVEVLWDEVGRPRFSYDKWRADILPAEPIESVPKQYAPSCVDGFISDGLKNWAKRQIPEGSRHNTLVADARWLIKDCGLSKGDAEALLTMRVAASPGRHPITPKEIEGIVKWA